jgi:hypothetical protein
MPRFGATLDENESPPPEGCFEKIRYRGERGLRARRLQLIRNELRAVVETRRPRRAIFSHLQGCKGGLF